MTRFHTVLGCSALALLSTSQIASADITPNEVWQDWRDYMQGMGYSLTAKESTSGETLTVSNVKFDLATDPDQGEISVTVESIGFAQNDDGSVTVLLPAFMPVSLNITPAAADAEPVDMTVILNHSALDMIVSGSPTNMTSSYSAGTVGLKLGKLTVGDETLDPQNAKMAIVLKDVQSRTDSKLGAMRDYDQTATVGSVSYDMSFKEPDEPAIATVKGTSSDITFKANGILPLALAQVVSSSALA